LRLRQSGQNAAAANQFRALRTDNPDGQWLANYARLLEGLSWLAARDTNAALRAWDSLDRSGGSAPEARLARQHLVEVRLSRKRLGLGIEWTDSLEAKDMTPSAKSRVLLEKLEHTARRGERNQALRLFGQFLETHPKPDPMRRALDAMERGTAIQDPATLLAMGRWHFDQGDFTGCLRRLDAIPRLGVTPASLELKGRALLKLGRNAQAEAIFREVGAREEGLLWLARALQAQGKEAQAREVQDQYAQQKPASVKGQEIFWARGLEAEGKGNCEEASRFYKMVAQAGGQRSGWARVRNGYCWYKAGEWDKASRLLAEETKGEASAVEAAAWFQAKALDRLGKGAESKAVLAQLWQEHPWSFHGHLARRALGITDQQLRDSLTRLPLAVAEVQNQAFGFTRADSLTVLRARLAERADLGWLSRQELSILDERVQNSPAGKLLLCAWLEAQGLERPAQIRWRKHAANLPAQKLAKASRGLLQRIYPMPWKSEATKACAGSALIDPAFVHAVMRQESGFDPAIRSPAGAVGLLQLMPSTGREMARRQGIPDFETSQLTDPLLNLRLGVAYMRDITRAWGGRPALVLANYNAGPLPCQDWKKAFDRLPLEEAAEEITFWETRGYVKKVMGNWWTYQAIWGTD
jgi:soluble lytic murein transglycosylase-like protein